MSGPQGAESKAEVRQEVSCQEGRSETRHECFGAGQGCLYRGGYWFTDFTPRHDNNLIIRLVGSGRLNSERWAQLVLIVT